jgi:hypothetical protein
MWFVNWLRRTNVTLLSVQYICVQPPELMETKLKNYKPTIESCTSWNPLFMVAIAMSSFGVLVIVAIIRRFHLLFHQPRNPYDEYKT